MVVMVSCERELFVSVVYMSAATRVRVDRYTCMATFTRMYGVWLEERVCVCSRLYVRESGCLYVCVRECGYLHVYLRLFSFRRLHECLCLCYRLRLASCWLWLATGYGWLSTWIMSKAQDVIRSHVFILFVKWCMASFSCVKFLSLLKLQSFLPPAKSITRGFVHVDASFYNLWHKKKLLMGLWDFRVVQGTLAYTNRRTCARARRHPSVDSHLLRRLMYWSVGTGRQGQLLDRRRGGQLACQPLKAKMIMSNTKRPVHSFPFYEVPWKTQCCAKSSPSSQMLF